MASFCRFSDFSANAEKRDREKVMKHTPIIAFLIIGIFLISAPAGQAKFALIQTRDVPIPRLVKNLEAMRADALGSMDKALIDFRIGRLHAMAYAQKTEIAPADAHSTPGSQFELPEFGHKPDHSQFPVIPAKSAAKEASAKAHLKEAIKYLSAAIKSDSSLLAAKLGLAWCYEQSGDKKQALALYRQVFKEAYLIDKESKGGMRGWSISVETAEYLRKMLDPEKDKKELAKLNEQTSEVEKLPRYVTPIMIPLTEKVGLEHLLVDKRISFDLDGFGSREYDNWLSSDAAWLVFDRQASGQITSGLQLVGQSSFWIFWKNGYEVLAGLDDDRNGLLQAEELDGIAVWHDRNINGVSEPGEVKPLSSLKIAAIDTRCSQHRSGIKFNPSGIRYSDGSTAPSYDLILRAAAKKGLVPRGPMKHLTVPVVR